MALENINGCLFGYKELKPGTFQHADQIAAERRTNLSLRNCCFYTADGALYNFEKGKTLWAITREPQNLVLRNIDEACIQLTNQKNYFPDAIAAKSSLEHPDTVVVDVKGLNLLCDYGEYRYDEYGYFEVHPKKVKNLNSQQRIAAVRIFGPDEDNFGQNMEMFAKARILPYVFVLISDHVKYTLRKNDSQYLGLASWLSDFEDSSIFNASFYDVSDCGCLRGERSYNPASDAAKRLKK